MRRRELVNRVAILKSGRLHHRKVEDLALGYQAVLEQDLKYSKMRRETRFHISSEDFVKGNLGSQSLKGLTLQRNDSKRLFDAFTDHDLGSERTCRTPGLWARCCFP